MMSYSHVLAAAAARTADGSAARYVAQLSAAAAGTSTVDVTSDATAGAVRPGVYGPHMRVRWEIADSGNGDSSHTFSVRLALS